MNLSSKNKVKINGGMAAMRDFAFLPLFFIIMSLMISNQEAIDLPKNDIKPVTELTGEII